MSSGISVAFGGAQVRIDASPRVCDAMQARFAPFVVDGGAPTLRLRVEEREPFEPELDLASAARLTRVADGRFQLEGTGGRGVLDVDAREGVVEDAAGLGAVDGMVRAALSLLLPLDGALLLHGALAGDTAFVGDSGAGKSTVARALGAACDELVIARPTATGVRFFSTPYWGGRPFHTDGRALVCLSRGTGSLTPVRGAAALKAILRHAVRFVAWPQGDRALFSVAADLSSRVTVLSAACPTGEAFLPFLFGALA
jgi:hypothetical protein